MNNVFTENVLTSFVQQAPELKEIVEKVQPRLEPTGDPPFDHLIRSIIYQQLSGKSASAIYGRFKELVGIITPKSILQQSKQDLRDVGLSRQKAGYIRNVANNFQQGGELAHLTTSADLTDLDNTEIIELLTAIKGVGEWTVQMYLIFGLGRMNVLAVKDLGVRKGIELLYDLPATPTPSQARREVEHWEGYSTVGTVLCWRVQD